MDFAVMVARASGGKLKASARRALRRSSALYLSDDGGEVTTARGRFSSWRDEPFYRELLDGLPVYTGEDLPRLTARLKSLHTQAASDGAAPSQPSPHSR